MEGLDDLFDVFDESQDDSVGLYLPTNEDVLDTSKKREAESEDEGRCSKKKKISKESSDDPEESSAEQSEKETSDSVEAEPTWKSDMKTYLSDYSKSERGRVITVETLQSCVHEVAIPPNVEYVPLVKSTRDPAKEYQFVLDPFQKEAILCIDNDQSVLISAHTSAGKTVAAEYSIALALRDNQRVIYTTPIKALSNQKYREFSDEFKDVGLVTGDVTINYEASCLIMTTEILRNMLYRGSQIMREVKWVIFDEIHYMRDKERGVVWEETLILLPDNVRFVFLSATIPNACQFAEWVAYIHRQPCHVVYTEFRPVPLQHYLFPAGGAGIHLIVDEFGNFREDNFNLAMSLLTDGNPIKEEFKNKWKQKQQANRTDCFNVVKMLMERSMAPIIAFSFSKKECEVYAIQMAKLDFSTKDEKKLIEEILNNALDVLTDDDRQLPQVQSIRPLLLRGIGVHHGGLLPILKETVEILFAENLLKILFATETFAMGLNMPARTVLFTSCRKFDGKQNRFVTSGEYIQMSGRAGRRGLDDKGIVLLMIDEKVSPDAAKNLVKGQADPLNSAFHLTYNMILNLLRVEDISPEYMLERSFAQFQNQASIPKVCERLQKLQKEFDTIKIPNENKVALYYTLKTQIGSIQEKIRQTVIVPMYVIPFLQVGRMVKIKDELREYDWGIILNFKKQDNHQRNPSRPEPFSLNVDVMVPFNKTEDKIGSNMEIITIRYNQIISLGAVRLNCPHDLRSNDSHKVIGKSLQEVKKRFEEIPLLDPIKDMNVTSSYVKKFVTDLDGLKKKLESHPLHRDPKIAELCERYAEKFKVSEEIETTISEFKKLNRIDQLGELKRHKKVLRKLEYCSTTEVVETKGKIACELSSGEELLMTELIFNGVFTDLNPSQCVALLSCFMCDEKSNTSVQMTEELSGPLRRMQELARMIVRVSKECHIEIEEDAYIERFRPYLMDVCNAWCGGSSFLEVCRKTDIFEGSIIRAFRRLEEALRQLVQATRNIGNNDLEEKFNESIRLLKRGKNATVTNEHLALSL